MTTGGLPPRAHSDDLTLLHTVLDGVLATDVDCLSVAELLDRACQLQTLSARIDAARALVLAAADTATEAPGVLRELGFRTASHVVAADTGAPAHDVRAAARERTMADRLLHLRPGPQVDRLPPKATTVPSPI